MRYLAAFLLLLTDSLVMADVYKWVDESGGVHYGDQPLAETNAQSVEIIDGPSQGEIDRARQQMRDKIGQRVEISGESNPSGFEGKPPQEVNSQTAGSACFAPLSDKVHGLSAETFTPITPTLLSKSQQISLRKLFEKFNANWKGTISDLRCTGSSSKPDIKITEFETRATVNWDIRNSRLTIETDSTGKESGVNEQLIKRFEVGDALFFSDKKRARVINLEGNKVEVLTRNQNEVSFLIKRHISTAGAARRPRGEVRYLIISGRTLKLGELFYVNGMLIGSRTWNLHR